MDYTRLPLAECTAQLETLAHEAFTTFGSLDSRPLNWKPTETAWSVGQCFDHLLKVNQMMLRAMDDALAQGSSQTLWQRIPFWPNICGRLLIRSQAPTASGKYSAPAVAQPATSSITADIVAKFVDQHRKAATSLQLLDYHRATRVIMTSPLSGIVTYSVADGWRLLIAHDWRHIEQARRVTQTSGFPHQV